MCYTVTSYMQWKRLDDGNDVDAIYLDLFMFKFT